ncbi:MAG: addiction module protein [Elainellaceae cyanobacterium]
MEFFRLSGYDGAIAQRRLMQNLILPRDCACLYQRLTDRIVSVKRNVVKSMHPLLKVDISQMSIAERIQLAEDLWDSIIENIEAIPVTSAQQEELDNRLERYHQNPSEGSDWEKLKLRID